MKKITLCCTNKQFLKLVTDSKSHNFCFEFSTLSAFYFLYSSPVMMNSMPLMTTMVEMKADDDKAEPEPAA